MPTAASSQHWRVRCLGTQLDLPPSHHTVNRMDHFPGWEEEETTAEPGIAQAMLRYRITSPAGSRRCPSACRSPRSHPPTPTPPGATTTEVKGAEVKAPTRSSLPGSRAGQMQR